jgi:hypothetical protein
MTAIPLSGMIFSMICMAGADKRFRFNRSHSKKNS